MKGVVSGRRNYDRLRIIEEANPKVIYLPL
jgi:hypothetical protein